MKTFTYVSKLTGKQYQIEWKQDKDPTDADLDAISNIIAKHEARTQYLQKVEPASPKPRGESKSVFPGPPINVKTDNGVLDIGALLNQKPQQQYTPKAPSYLDPVSKKMIEEPPKTKPKLREAGSPNWNLALQDENYFQAHKMEFLAMAMSNPSSVPPALRQDPAKLDLNRYLTDPEYRKKNLLAYAIREQANILAPRKKKATMSAGRYNPAEADAYEKQRDAEIWQMNNPGLSKLGEVSDIINTSIANAVVGTEDQSPVAQALRGAIKGIAGLVNPIGAVQMGGMLATGAADANNLGFLANSLKDMAVTPFDTSKTVQERSEAAVGLLALLYGAKHLTGGLKRVPGALEIADALDVAPEVGEGIRAALKAKDTAKARALYEEAKQGSTVEESVKPTPIEQKPAVAEESKPLTVEQEPIVENAKPPTRRGRSKKTTAKTEEAKEPPITETATQQTEVIPAEQPSSVSEPTAQQGSASRVGYTVSNRGKRYTLAPEEADAYRKLNEEYFNKYENASRNGDPNAGAILEEWTKAQDDFVKGKQEAQTTGSAIERTELESKGSLTIHMDDGTAVLVQPNGDAVIVRTPKRIPIEDIEGFKAEYGREPTPQEMEQGALGRHEMKPQNVDGIDVRGVIEVATENRPGDPVIIEEMLHNAIRTGLLDSNEVISLIKANGGVGETAKAIALRKTKLPVVKRVIEWAKGLWDRLVQNDRFKATEFYKKWESGEIWKRKPDVVKGAKQQSMFEKSTGGQTRYSIKKQQVEEPQETTKRTGISNKINDTEFEQGLLNDIYRTTGKSAEDWHNIGKQLVEEGADPIQLAKDVAQGKAPLTPENVAIARQGKAKLLEDIIRAQERLKKDPTDAVAQNQLKAAQEAMDDFLLDLQTAKGKWSELGRAMQEGVEVYTGDFASMRDYASTRENYNPSKHDPIIKDAAEKIRQADEKIIELEAKLADELAKSEGYAKDIEIILSEAEDLYKAKKFTPNEKLIDDIDSILEGTSRYSASDAASGKYASDSVHSKLADYAYRMVKENGYSTKDIIDNIVARAADRGVNVDVGKLGRLVMDKVKADLDVQAAPKTKASSGTKTPPKNRLERLQRMIDEVQRRIDEKDFSTKEKAKTEYTPEEQALKDKLDALRKQYSRLKSNTKRKVEIEAEIADLERRLNEKDFTESKKTKSKKTDPELESLKKRRDELKRKYEEAKKADPQAAEALQKKQTQARIEAMRKRIAELERRLKEGDFEPQKRAEGKADSAEVTAKEQQVRNKLDRIQKKYDNARKAAQNVRRLKEKIDKLKAQVEGIQQESGAEQPKGQPRKLTPEERKLTQEYEKLKRQHQKAEQAKRTADKLKAEIDELKRRLNEKDYSQPQPKQKSKKPMTAEQKKLAAERDKLKAQLKQEQDKIRAEEIRRKRLNEVREKIERVKKQLAGELPYDEPKTKTPRDPALEAEYKRLNELRKELRKKRAKTPTEAELQKKELDKINRQIKNIEAKLNGNPPKAAPKRTIPDTPEIQQARQKLADLRSQLNDKNKDIRQKKHIADRMAEIRRQIQDYEERFSRGDYSPRQTKPKTKREISGELEDLIALRNMYDQAARSYMKDLDMSPFAKFMETSSEAYRGWVLGSDVGMLFRQGILAVSHPVMAARSIAKGLKAAGSNAGYDAVMHDLRYRTVQGRNGYVLGKKSGLQLTDRLIDREELTMTHLLSRVPLLKYAAGGLERFQVAYINDMRAQLFDTFAKGTTDPAQLKIRARFVNNATGRGNLKGVSKTMRALLLSPRFEASRWGMIGELLRSPAELVKHGIKPGSAAWMNTKDIWTTIGIMYGLAKIAEANGATLCPLTDISNPDWLKVRFGDMVIDLSGGIVSRARLALQIVATFYKTITGQKVSNNEAMYITKAVGKEASRIIHPSIRFAIDKSYEYGQRYQGIDEKKIKSFFTGTKLDDMEKKGYSFLPLCVRSFIDGTNKMSVDAGTAAYILDSVGFGVQIYPPRPEMKKTNLYLKEKFPKYNVSATVPKQGENESDAEYQKRLKLIDIDTMRIAEQYFQGAKYTEADVKKIVAKARGYAMKIHGASK